MLGILMMGMGCNGDKDDDTTETRVIEEKYRGTFVWANAAIILNEKELIMVSFYNEINESRSTFEAYTEGNELYRKGGDVFDLIGTFTDENTFVTDGFHGSTYNREID